MDVFDLRRKLVEDYGRYTRSFIKISDPRIEEFVIGALSEGAFWPEPLLQLNPTFQPGGTVDDLTAAGTLHPECARIFRINKTDGNHTGDQLFLHQHQREAILKAKEGKSYVLTSGTGSGKSLTYIVPIVDHVLRNGTGRGIQAIVVYPMNALANSQDEELRKFLEKGYPGGSPVTFARYTGQEKQAEREAIRANPPDILLTNYMMLELLLTRREDRELVRRAQGIRFLVFDELHTYRGRQGADVALLIRRCRLAFGGHDILCIGTSATMASGGTTADQKLEVAKVAQTLFGVPFDSTQVIGESLERATPELNFSDPSVVTALRMAVQGDVSPPETYDTLRAHPLSAWIESTFGVRSEDASGYLIRQAPRRLAGEELEGRLSAAEELAAMTGAPAGTCAVVLRRFLLTGSHARKTPSSRFPLFAFRLHQFFTRGDTVWTTMEPEKTRHLEIAKKGAKPGEPEKPLYPLVFCRQCGTPYYRVRITTMNAGRVLSPREDRRADDSDNGEDGYLYISESAPWPAGEETELLKRVPEAMKELTSKGTERVSLDQRRHLPEAVHVDPTGLLVSEGEGIAASLIRRDFRFCLDPACGIHYAGTQRSERAKLSTLGVDSRSTATTVLAVRSLIELQGDRDLQPEARKLLSFTDNRQDASLQAGHFNDFAQVALLRSALHRATEQKGASGLGHGELSGSIFDAMKLRFEDYAADPDVRGPARNATNDALRRVIDYYVYRDLQRGWRVTAPNLEDCGLLKFDYDGLTGSDGVLGEEALWTSGITPKTGSIVVCPEALRVCPPELREEVLRTLLDVLRRSLAVKTDVLDPQKQLDLVEKTKPRLQEGTVWYLEDVADLSKAEVAYPRPKAKSDRGGLFVSSFGGYGRYVRRVLSPFITDGQKFGRTQVDEVIRFLFLVLKRYGIVEQVRSGREGDDPGYQVNADAMRWLPADGTIRPVDRTRLIDAGETPPEANLYFVECYRSFVDLKTVLEAREHTAAVPSEDREEREDRFRTGALPLLFCSPTMELGVDIAQLNLVNLRNVPPTPANYAQRSGRAGRGGQPALVFTYCAGRSPHDQYFFREPSRMVAGSVVPPRIDVRNRDLVRSHVHAIWMEVAKPDLGRTLTAVVDLTDDDGKIPLPVRNSIVTELRNPTHRAGALAKANALVASIRDELASTTWFNDNWTREVLDQVERDFDSACDRWRALYRAALRQRELHHRIIGDHSRPEAERNHSRRLRAQAESQIKLLTEAEGVFEGDFYSYRYFAAEGFLPGYNFPRLPISAYVPGRNMRRGRDEFVSRPRFLALSEFGPRALVYHEGARYRVYKVNLDFGSPDIENTHDLVTASMKRCPGCGYAHLEQGTNLAEICSRCGVALDGPARIDNLVQLQNVSLKLAQRITCDEEERQRFGYKIVTAYRFPEVGGQQDRKDAEVYVGERLVARVSYGDATELFRINLGWSRQQGTQPPGFNLDLERGYWSRNQADDEDKDDANANGRVQRVVPFVRDTKNALVLRLEPPRPGPEMASLQAAFKQAIQKHFQLESRELTSESMPTSWDRREILFYEASEGGAGVLRQIAEDPAVLPLLARRALETCHFDPNTLADQAAATCGKACYECLLDYGNQLDHKDLDRAPIRDFLHELSNAECRPAGGAGSRADRLAALRKRCDSKLEMRWLDMVDTLMLRPPSEAQYQVPGIYTQPDFFYRQFNAAIYIDGPPHDEAKAVREDADLTKALMEMGYIVIRFHHKENWLEVFRRHPDVFGVPKS